MMHIFSGIFVIITEPKPKQLHKEKADAFSKLKENFGNLTSNLIFQDSTSWIAKHITPVKIMMILYKY